MVGLITLVLIGFEMHPSVMEFVERVLPAKQVRGSAVLEVGSYNENGSVRPYVESLGPELYLGIDMRDGPGVDEVINCEYLPDVWCEAWHFVISTEMLEHVRNWRVCMMMMAKMVRQNGYLLLTTRSPGFPYHPFPEDHWRFTVEDMRRIMLALRMEVVALETDRQQPGVFVLARNRQLCLKDIDVQRVTSHG